MSSEVLIVKSLNSASPKPVIFQPETPAEYPEDLNIEDDPLKIISAALIVPDSIMLALISLTSIELISVGCDAVNDVHGPLFPVLSTDLILP